MDVYEEVYSVVYSITPDESMGKKKVICSLMPSTEFCCVTEAFMKYVTCSFMSSVGWWLGQGGRRQRLHEEFHRKNHRYLVKFWWSSCDTQPSDTTPLPSSAWPAFPSSLSFYVCVFLTFSKLVFYSELRTATLYLVKGFIFLFVEVTPGNRSLGVNFQKHAPKPQSHNRSHWKQANLETWQHANF